LGGVGTDRRSVTPRPSVEGVDQRSGSGGRLINEMRRVIMFMITVFILLVIRSILFGGGGSVRRRNTLHEVAGFELPTRRCEC
jgi:hypothetical protein